MSRTDPARLELEYAPGMALAQAFNPNAKRLLNFGAGCGTFERFFAAHFPELQIESVEAEPALIDIAKEYFELPHNHEIHLASAQSYLDSADTRADIVLCDLHNGDENPSFLIDPSFYQDVRDCMNEGAVLALNLLPRDRHDLIEVQIAVQSVFERHYLLDFDNIGNVMLYAFDHQPIKREQIQQQADQLAVKSKQDFSALIRRLKLQPKQFNRE